MYSQEINLKQNLKVLWSHSSHASTFTHGCHFHFFCRSSMLVFQCECMLISKWHNNYLLTFYNIWLILTDANYLKLIRLVYHSLIPFLFILFNLLSFNFFVFSGIQFIIQYWHTVWYHLWCSVYSVTEWIPVT